MQRQQILSVHANLATGDIWLDLQVKVIFTGLLHNYEDICSLYAGCDKLAQLNNPADLLLHIYLQACSMCLSSQTLRCVLAYSRIPGPTLEASCPPQ